jgi:5-methyltetrahydropteroyltriglutamate--homocysteine methyltransferase
MIACHADHVGSLLRPSELISAREDAAAGRISRARFKVIEDRAVEDVIRLQESVGLPVVSGLGDWDLNAFLWGDWRGDSSTALARRLALPGA